MKFDIDGEAAVVTASSSGLGRASAAALLAEGANVTICGRDEERLAAAEADLAGAGPGAVLAVPADVTDPDDVEGLVAAAVEAFGGVDHLVTSAGGPPPGGFADTTERDWYVTYDLLVMSVVWALEEALPHLLDGGGTVTCIASRTVQEVADGMVLSNAVRRGVVGLVKTISREYAPALRANAVLPGSIETNRVANLVREGVERGEYDGYEDGLHERRERIPMDRLGRPEELGSLVAFLASDRAGFVNGAQIPVDGGELRS